MGDVRGVVHVRERREVENTVTFILWAIVACLCMRINGSLSDHESGVFNKPTNYTCDHKTGVFNSLLMKGMCSDYENGVFNKSCTNASDHNAKTWDESYDLQGCDYDVKTWNQSCNL